MEPKPTNLPRAIIEEIAGKFSAKVGYSPGKPLEKIVKMLGGEISVREALFDGEIEVSDGGRFRIFLSPYTGRTRDRFTMAHELGHYVLHSRMGREQIKIARRGSNKVESEANFFAAALLMPERDFRATFREHHDDGAVAAYFDVSWDAVRVRKLLLGIGNGSLDESGRTARSGIAVVPEC